MHDARPQLTNPDERRRWNDGAWVSQWVKREAMTAEVSAYVLHHLEPAADDAILEVGPGGGTATVALAGAVPDGKVVGADISESLTDLARRRAAERGLGNVRFVVADVQHDTVEGAPFDAAVSQFGVMFFDQPVTAFANIRRHVVPGGRLAFACWREPELNPWLVNAVLAPFLPRPPAPPPGKRRTGPFSLADFSATAAMLESAGWEGVSGEDHDIVINVPLDSFFEEEALAALGVAEEDREEALQAVECQVAPLRRADGAYDAPLAFRVVTARAPR